MTDKPEQWAQKVFWDAIKASGSGDYEAGYDAIQRAFEDHTREFREAAEDKAWLEARELVRGTNADLYKGGARQAYILIIGTLTDAIHNRNLRTFNGRVEHLRTRKALGERP